MGKEKKVLSVKKNGKDEPKTYYVLENDELVMVDGQPKKIITTEKQKPSWEIGAYELIPRDGV